jgi:uncharacterized protein YjbI with pentapeptide repeats
MAAPDPSTAVVRFDEEELTGAPLPAGRPIRLVLNDVVLRACDLSNVVAPSAALGHVRAQGTRALGLSLEEATLRDVAFLDCATSLASFARATLRDVRFERCDLREASFLGARLLRVELVDCDLGDADFRDVTTVDCALRGCSLESVLGIGSLRGCRMPWTDVVASAGAFAAELGIEVEGD